MTRHLTLLLCGISLLAACGKEEPPPRSVTELVENPILLEAAMVRCAQDRAKYRYDAECVNARAAVDRIQAKEEAAAKAALEVRSERKRAALRRTQEAAREARRRAAEAQRKREEAEYLAQFGVLPSDDTATTAEEPLVEGNVPIAAIPEAAETAAPDGESAYEGEVDESSPVTEGGNAPVMQTEADAAADDLESIRDELRRRGQEGGD